MGSKTIFGKCYSIEINIFVKNNYNEMLLIVNKISFPYSSPAPL